MLFERVGTAELEATFDEFRDDFYQSHRRNVARHLANELPPTSNIRVGAPMAIPASIDELSYDELRYSGSSS